VWLVRAHGAPAPRASLCSLIPTMYCICIQSSLSCIASASVS
jgi:hypothetical protein